MDCTNIATELPPPLYPKAGWPWDPAGHIPELTPEEAATLPTISIVTPSYQQGRFIEETIRSILLQGYPKLEYIIMDGGSTDETVEVIQHYERWITHWQSAKDAGQADAVKRGWERATGNLVAWLNSDDVYSPGALVTVARAYVAHASPAWLSGAVRNQREGRPSRTIIPRPFDIVDVMGRFNCTWHQPGMFWRRDFVQRLGSLNEEMNFSFDHDFWVRSVLAGEQPVCIEDELAMFRLHGEAKSSTLKRQWLAEDHATAERYRDRVTPEQFARVQELLAASHADYYLAIVHDFVQRGKRFAALKYLLTHMSLVPRLEPRPIKQFLGMLWRIAAGGKEPLVGRSGQRPSQSA